MHYFILASSGNLLAQSVVSYLCLMFGGKSFSHVLVFVFSMGYLSVCHIYRQVYDYGGYTLDITGPLMIQTQKLTSLAFALHDGRYKQEGDLSVDQNSQAVRLSVKKIDVGLLLLHWIDQVSHQVILHKTPLSDAVNNAAGFGFSGFDSQGTPQWDLTDNVDIWGVELSTSLKVNIDSWNKKTLVWLRRIVYDRAPSSKTLAVFTCSAFWHGFYPGYYLTFGTGALMTVVARQVGT
ncbi:Lysophospholipid acyltransferase 2 [Bulinus truncatus]|nr:Lysophospholipid acyltransferase 2 [Bulinus truncatus]